MRDSLFYAMKYLGSKRRLVPDILPIMLHDMQPGQSFIDAFCGGCSVIGSVPPKYPRIANDNNRYLVAVLKALCSGVTFPTTITRNFYCDVRTSYHTQDGRYSDALIGWVGFMGSYNGRFFDGGYSGHNVKGRDYIGEQIKNTLSQLPLLRGISWKTGDYQDIVIPPKSLIYCDPPYRGTQGYTTGNFDYHRFYEWVRKMDSEGHKVFVSEYQMPGDFVCIWEKEIVNNYNKSRTTEKLWTIK